MIDLPTGWKLGEDDFRGERKFSLLDAKEERAAWCQTHPLSTFISLEAMTTHGDVCGASAKVKKTETLPSGVWYVECGISGPGPGGNPLELDHVSTVLTLGDKQVRCWFQPRRRITT